MFTYLLKRLLEMIPTLIGITLISFFIIQLAPGKPTDVLADLNPKMTPEARERLEKYYGLDKPIHIQYVMWLKRIVKLDFGDSFSTDRRPVWTKIKERLPITILINTLALVLIFIIAIPIGVSSAVRPYSLYDKITTVVVFIGFAIPTFWLALLLMILFGVNLHWLPISGLKSMGYENLSALGKIWDWTQHLILPMTLEAFGGLAGYSRYMRSSMLEVVRQDYITTARAKGLSERKVIYKHALRNALLPVITLLGMSIPGLIGGSVIFENIFSIPGMGQLFFQSVMMRDYPVIMGILTIGAILTLLGNLLADIGHAVADPRIRTR
ncbi:MAG: diguanylate cyclase [Deltaproteobacteria bacterium RIFCSPLOWO2_02_44_9]|nr:MAG: diguanylate cyclase [Deltaproteobacteria bacterium RIFCSPLOWO2_02_44_9]